ncbi:acyl carrier protein [Duganella sp. Root1480D1]|uniref:acyl carrier protein n=1 Tax=Duganella sp. Root1480D1 TaxID=1736471 RepID=UPI000ACEF67E|nr:acyl carrier protein [Duganella sp. Root1480D1]
MQEQELRMLLAGLLQVPPEQLASGSTLSELGVDSLLGLRFARKIQDTTGTEFDLEWLFDYPTIEQLAAFLARPAGQSQAITS